MVPRRGEWDRKAMDRYVRIAAALREAGIEPVVTLHHFTNPGWLAEEGSWEDPSTLGEFLRFAERAVRALRGHARVFVTFNEPNVFIAGGYLGGVMPPPIRTTRSTTPSTSGTTGRNTPRISMHGKSRTAPTCSPWSA